MNHWTLHTNISTWQSRVLMSGKNNVTTNDHKWDVSICSVRKVNFDIIYYQKGTVCAILSDSLDANYSGECVNVRTH